MPRTLLPGRVALAFLLGLTPSACSLVDPNDRERLLRPDPPPRPAQVVINDTLARTPDGCAAVNVVITATTLSTAFPLEASCGSGLILRPAGNHSIVRDSTHWRVSLRVAWRNNTGASISGARRLILPADSGIVLLPVSGYGTDPVAMAPDGAVSGAQRFAGAPYWNVGSGTTPNGGITADTVVTVDVPVGTQHVLLRFGGDSLAAPSGRPPVPDGWWAPTDSTLAVLDTDSRGNIRAFRMFLTVSFSPGATGSEIRSALNEVNATIVGGSSSLAGNHTFKVQIPDPGSLAGPKAVITTLSTKTGVAFASKNCFGPTRRSPSLALGGQSVR
jgi:hypothetical protein